jgi:G:T-mismatch repair DNA endonuclease (very short patch repair protein)
MEMSKKRRERISNTLKRKVKNNEINIWNKELSGEEYSKHYKDGHPKGMLGKVMSDESNKKKALFMKQWHKDNKNTEMYINRNRKLSEAMKGKKKSEEHTKKNKLVHLGQIPWNKGKTGIYSKDTRKRISEGNKGRITWMKGKYHTEESKKIIKEKRKNQIFPIKDTSIEIKIQNFLNELDIPFLKHQYMEIEHGYQCDIIIPSLNLVIECDGDWWHGNPVKYPNPTEWQSKQIEEDKLRTQELINSGLKVLRLWEDNIKIMDLDDFKEIISNEI